MALIQCTKKLLDELGDKITAEAAPDQSPLLGNWHANLIKLGRVKCVLFTNDATLYSFFVPKLIKKDFGNLRALFLEYLVVNLEHEGFAKYIDKVLKEYEYLNFSKTSSRSVLGSMNDIAYSAGFYLYKDGGIETSYCLGLNKHLNDMPLKAIGYHCGIEQMHKKLTGVEKILTHSLPRI